MNARETLAIRVWFFLMIIGFGVLLGVAVGERHVAVPKCPEDSMIVGQGDFHDGRWERYTCGPAADSVVTSPDGVDSWACQWMQAWRKELPVHMEPALTAHEAAIADEAVSGVCYP